MAIKIYTGRRTITPGFLRAMAKRRLPTSLQQVKQAMEMYEPPQTNSTNVLTRSQNVSTISREDQKNYPLSELK
jgi:hypothetical protein